MPKVTNLIEMLLQLLICKIDTELLKTIQKEPCQLQDHILYYKREYLKLAFYLLNLKLSNP